MDYIEYAQLKLSKAEYPIALILSKKDELTVSEIMKLTGYRRNTINASMHRLMNHKKLMPSEIIYRLPIIPEYVYCIKEEYRCTSITEDDWKIIEFLQKYNNKMTPNAYRLILILLQEGEFIQADLYERFSVLKKSSVSETAKRLYEDLMILDCKVKDGKRIYSFKEEWLEKVKDAYR